MAYLIPAERTERGITTRRELLNNAPRLTAVQRRYGWRVTGPARMATDADRNNIIADSRAIEMIR